MPTITAYAPNHYGQRFRSFTDGPFRVKVEPNDCDVADARCEAYTRRLAIAVGALQRQTPFAPCYVRRLPNGRLFMAGKPTVDAFGYEYDDWGQLLAEWDVEPAAVRDTECGTEVEVVPVRRPR